MNKLYQVVDQPAVIPSSPQQSHQFLHTRQAGVEVPLLQSVVIGFLTFVFVTFIGYSFMWMEPWKWGGMVGMGVTLGWMGWSLNRWTELTRPMVQISSVDHDDDPATPNVVRIELSKVKEDGHYEWNTFNLPDGVTNEMMVDLANGILNMGRRFTELEWCGPGKPFSMPKFRQLRALLENRNLTEPVNEKDKRQGIKFNTDGEQFLQGFLA